MRAFDFYLPTSLSDALRILEELGAEAAPLAGGTDLVIRMKANDKRPRAVVGLRRIAELKGIHFDAREGMRLGSRVTLRELIRSPFVQEHYPILSYAAGTMASEQVRSRATVGGNLVNAAPSADLAPPLLVLGAELRLASLSGERQVPLSQFFLGPGSTQRQPSELLIEIRLPPPEGHSTYLKHSPREHMDVASVGVAVRVARERGNGRGVRIALGAVAPVPMLARRAAEALDAQSLTSSEIGRAAEIAAEECSPIDDARASASYRRQMVSVLTRRCLEAVAAQ
jgi:carbon-monoxide dehydrogenase medium subunit